MFLINRGEIEGRLDTVFYKPLYLKNEEAIRRSKWGYEKLNFLAQRLVDGPFGSDLKVDEYQPSGIPLLRVSNIKTGEVEGNLVFISDEKQLQLKRSTVFPNDVLLTKAGAILGYSAVFPEHLKRGNITSHLVAITCKKTINPYYLSHYFRCNIGQLQIYRWGNKSTRPELNTSEVKNILVTLPPLDIQGEIVDKMEAAYKQRKQKEAEAVVLLASINGYLLQELGITLPPPSEKKTYFLTRSNHLTGVRFDPFYHQVEFEENKTVVKNGHYKAVPLKQLVEKLVKGKLPKDTEKDGDLKVIQINSINPDGHIDTSDLLTAQAIFTREQQMQKNDVLVVITGATIGKVAIWEFEENEEYFLGGDIVKFQCLKNINPQFIFAWLRCQNSQIEIKKNVTGATNGHLSPSDIGNILIPLPSPEKQTEIATHISALRTQAKQLQQQAADELAHAKLHVEHLILGE